MRIDAMVDILICGTGLFAERILCDLAATANEPISVVIAGRNAERLDWLSLAANSRATIFGKAVSVGFHQVDFRFEDTVAECISRLKPRVIVQSASAQPSAIIGVSNDAWSRLVAETSLSVTALFQAYLSIRVARVAKTQAPQAYFVNCCYPDVANSILKALNLPVSCGLGNVAIMASVFSAHLRGPPQPVKVLAHYQTLTPWRQPREERRGRPPRVWLGDEEILDVFSTFADVKLTRAPVIEVSGAANVPMLTAMAVGKPWSGHAPGPDGLPGGYPVALKGGVFDLDLPAGLSRGEAIAWNAKFEKDDGLYVSDDNRLVFAGKLQTKLNEFSPTLAAGFAIEDFNAAYDELTALRARLQNQA
jgi:hypothetical protein